MKLTCESMRKIVGIASVSLALLWAAGCFPSVLKVEKESVAWPLDLCAAVAEDAAHVADPLAEKMATAPRVQIILPKDEDFAGVVKTLEENCKRQKADSRRADPIRRRSDSIRPPTQEDLKSSLEKVARLIRERAMFAGLQIIDDGEVDYRVELVITAKNTEAQISAACVQVATGKRHDVCQDKGLTIFDVRWGWSTGRKTLVRNVLSLIPVPCALVEETRGGGRFARLGQGRFRNNEVVAVYTHQGGVEVEVGHGLVVKHDANTAWLEIYNYRQAGVRVGYYVK